MRWKCGLLILGLVLLGVLLSYGKRMEEARKHREEAARLQEVQKEEENQAEENEDSQRLPEREEEPEIPIPVYNGKIRVLMKGPEYANIYHEKLSITDGEQQWEFEVENDSAYVNGEPIEAERFPVCLDRMEDGRYTILSLERSYGKPSLEGRVEIYHTEQGFVLVNELWLEEYLKYVVPSEMPASYELEALKAQAVCARTYAYSQMQTYAYPEYLAHVDDSVQFQVYQNLDASPRTNQAVEETRGQILTYGGHAITAYYFSTSWGHTTNEEIWWEGDAEATPYLLGHCIDSEGTSLDLCEEEAFYQFLKEPGDGFYESDISWFRWNTRIDLEQLSANLNEALAARYEANPEAILTKRAGKFFSMPVKSIGTIKEIQVVERGQGGVLQCIQVSGSKRTIRILTEYNIRALLNVKGEAIYRKDGSKVTGGSLLPSGYFALTPLYKNEKLTGYVIEGGGFGHGAGMSQNGANAMAKQGKSWTEILHTFYTEVELSDLAETGAM